MSRILLALALSFAAAAQQPWPLAEGTFAVTHVEVLTMERPELLRDRTVIVDDGVIAAIGAAADTAVPAGATEIDGRGHTLMPGMFDTHVHVNGNESDLHLWLYLAAGVTTVQSMHGSPEHLELRKRIAEGDVVGPRFLTTGPTTAMARINTPTKAEAFVRSQKDAGYDAIKMYGDGNNSMSRATYARVIDIAHELGMRVVGHAPRNMKFEAVLLGGQDSIDHMEEIYYTAEEITQLFEPLVDYQFGRKQWEEVEQLLTELDDMREALGDELVGLAEAVKEAGLAVAPTLVAFHTIWLHTTPSYEELRRDPRLRYVPAIVQRQWGPALNRYVRAWRSRREQMNRILGCSLELQKSLVKAFDDAGVPLMTGTDAPLTFVFPGTSLHREIELFDECGLPPFSTLRAATSTPATELGLGERVGTIAVGKEADLSLVRGNPLDDVRHVARVEGVFARGKWFDRAALDAGLEELAKAYAK